jgi:choline dehydrogenase-like flavoprotein
MRAGPIPPGFLDGSELRHGSEIHCDVCVIGSGAAGTTVALQLRRHGRGVLLLESGGIEIDPTASALHEVETTALPVGPEARQHVLGGTTSVWWGGSALLEEIDFEPRGWIGVPGWPLPRSELLPYYSEACGLLGIPDLTSRSVERFGDGPGFVVRNGDLDTVVLFWPRRPRRFRRMLEPAARRDEQLDVILNATATKLIAAAGGARIDAVEVRTAGSRIVRVRANEVVLACGGIENARLLLASHEAGVENDHDVIGRYYMDHPKGDAGVVKVTPGARWFPHPGYWDSRPGRYRLGIRISNERQRREDLLNGYLRLTPVLSAEGTGIEALRALQRRGAAAILDPDVLSYLMPGLPEIVRFVRFKLLNRGAVEAATITNFIEQPPRRENRVALSDRLDAFGQPLARLDWTIGDVERRTMRRLHALLRHDFSRRGLGDVDSPLLTRSVDPWPITRDASHHMGTTRMGSDPSTSVVDSNCRVHSVTNLYVAGSSVFATSGSANPTLTIVALALRLADHLGGRPAPLR